MASNAGRPLNPRQLRFAHELALQARAGQALSPVDAARKAGYKDTRALKVNACRQAKDPRVRAFVEQEQQRAAAQLKEDFHVDRSDLLREFAHMAFARVHDVIEWGQKGYYVRSPGEITERGHAALSEMSITEDRIGKEVVRRRTTVKLHKKVEALLGLARLAGFLTEERGPTAIAGVQIFIDGGPTGLERSPAAKVTPAPGPKRLPRGATVEVGG